MQLTTSRLILRDFVEDDLARVVEYRRNPLYYRYYPEEFSTEKEAREFVAKVIGWAAESPRRKYQLAIVRASDGLLLGNCGARGSAESRFGSEAEFGCELDPDYWQHGYATEAGRAIISLAFETLGVHRVFARTFSENRPAAQLAERLGMRLEGRLRERRFFKQRWWDHLFYAILEQEWRTGAGRYAGKP
jgi:ribosomal-protein-alanine N-acetyltransferase